MTKISRDDVAKLAALSSLQLSDAEADGLVGDLQTILGYVEQLDELDTAGVEPSYQVTGLKNIMRDDIVDAGDVGQAALLALAPQSHDNHVKVPKVI